MPFIDENIDDIELSPDEFSYALDAAEYRYSEITEQSGRTLHGTVLRYGDTSTANEYGSPERFEAGAFGDVQNSDVSLNIQHNRDRLISRTGSGLVLTDSPERLEIRATIVNTRDGDDALTMVEEGLLTGFSTEFFARRERTENRTRVISKAVMPRIGLVDDPAYSDSLVAEIRQAGEGISGAFLYDTDSIISASGKVRKESIQPGAFSYAVRAPDREITLILGSPDKPLASKTAGSLKLTDTPTGLRFSAPTLPRTSYTADFLGLLRGKSVTPGVIPFFSATPRSVARRLFSDGKAVIEEPEEPGSSVFRRIIRSALLNSLAIMFRAPRGNPGSISRIPTRLRRPSTAGANTIDAVRPRQGDVVRSGRVIRQGVDIGPVARQRWI